MPAGSHRWGQVEDVGGPPFYLSAGNNPSNNANGAASLPRGPLESGDEVDSWRRAVAVGMAPGDVSFHHCVRTIAMPLLAFSFCHLSPCLPALKTKSRKFSGLALRKFAAQPR